MGLILTRAKLHSNLGQVVYSYAPLSPSSVTWYRSRTVTLFGWEGDRRAESNGSLPLEGDDLKGHLQADSRTPGSAPGPTPGNEYGILLSNFTQRQWYLNTTKNI